jgi:hypothetical protein
MQHAGRQTTAQRSAAREEAEDCLDALLLAFDAIFVC